MGQRGSCPSGPLLALFSPVDAMITHNLFKIASPSKVVLSISAEFKMHGIINDECAEELISHPPNPPHLPLWMSHH